MHCPSVKTQLVFRPWKKDGRGIWPHAKADQVQKTQCKDTTSHCFMRVLIESNAGDSVFQLLRTKYRWNQPHLRPSKRLTCAHIHVYLSSCSAATATQLHLGA